MSAPTCWACTVRSRQSLADSAAVHDWTTTSGLIARASSIATSSRRLRSAIVNDQNSATPLVTHSIGCRRSPTQYRTSARYASQSMSSPSTPENGVYRESPIPLSAEWAHARASLAFGTIGSFQLTWRSREIAPTVDVDVGTGHVRVTPGGQKRDDGSDFVRQPGPRQMSRVTEVLRNSVHQRVGIAAVDAHGRGPADERLGRDAARRNHVDQNLILGQQQGEVLRHAVHHRLGGGIGGQYDALPLG